MPNLFSPPPEALHPERLKTAATLLPLGAALLCGLGFAKSARAEEAKTLETVEVRAAKEVPSYQPQVTTIGKMPQLPKDVPQAMTILTETLMEEKNAHTLKEALSNVAGLTFNAGEGGRIGDNMNLRGFYSFGDLYLDGIRDVAQYNRETFDIEQVDVLRGAGAMLFGRGQAGGVINRVSKQPVLDNRSEVAATVGTNSYQRVTADMNQVLGETTAVRINAMKTSAGSTRDNVKSEREGLAPTIRWGINTDHEFTLSHLYLKTHNTPDYGVPFYNQRPLDVPASRFYGTSRDYEDNVTNITTGSYKYWISPNTELKTVLRGASYDRSLWAVQPQLRLTGDLSDSSTINRSVKARGGKEDTLTSQTDLIHKFDLAGMRHETLTGLELLQEKGERWTYAFSGTMPSTTVGSSNADPAGMPGNYGNANKVGATTYRGFSKGIYMQDTVEFIPHWKLLFGLRKDYLNAKYDSGGRVNYDETSYRSGLSWQPSEYAHYYLSYSDSFNPTADLYQFTPAHANIKPERSQVYELGAKWELFEGDLSLRTAVYRAVKEWERNTDIETASTSTLLSKRRHTDGFEIEAAGRLTRNWEVFAGYALMDSRIDEQAYSISNTGVITQHSSSLVGMRPRNAPPWTYNLWTTYKLGNGWKIGGGVEGKGDRLAYGINANKPTVNVAPAYHRVDAMVSYTQDAYSVRLNVFNLLDKRYYESVYDNGGHAVPGTSRAAQLTFTYKF